jgi:hypothetical protein
VLVGHERRRQLVAQIAAQAGVDLSPAAAWLLVRKHCDPGIPLEELSVAWDVPLERAQAGLSELTERGMVSPNGPIRSDISSDIAAISDDNRPPGEPLPEPGNGSVSEIGPAVTESGHETAKRLIEARREAMARMLDGWEPERHVELATLLSRLAEEVSLTPSPKGG